MEGNTTEGHAPSPAASQGLSKSDSTRSHSSYASHRSITAIGPYPAGSLRIHVHEDPADIAAKAIIEEEEDENLPPLGQPVGGPSNGHRRSAIRRGVPHDLDADGGSLSPREIHKHGMGGGDVVLILDLPEVFTVGYDSISFTAKHFGGIRDIPAGPHFFWVSHPNGMSARCGFWIVSSGVDRLHVMQWDKFNEVISESARAEARIQARNVDSIHSKLVPYRNPGSVNPVNGDTQAPNEAFHPRVWRQLCGSLSENVLGRIMGIQENNWCVHTADRVRGASLIRAEMELDRAVPNPLFRSRDLNFTFNQGSKTFSTNYTGPHRTQEATDSTRYLLALVEHPSEAVSDDQLVGEFQFAFIVGMHLGNDSCMQEWWHMLLKLILRAYTLPLHRPLLASALLRALATQLSYSAKYLDHCIIDYCDGYAMDLRLVLIVYKRRLDELLLDLNSRTTPEQLAVGTDFAKVESFAASRGWDLRGSYLRQGRVTLEDGEDVELEVTDLQAEDERGEYAPEVVDLDEDGHQRDLISWTD